MPITVKYKDSGKVLNLMDLIQSDCRSKNWSAGGKKPLSMTPNAVHQREYMEKMRIERPDVYEEMTLRHRGHSRNRYHRVKEEEMVDLVCNWCKTPFRRRASLLKKSKTGNFYCCLECSGKMAAKKYRESREVVRCCKCNKILDRSPGEIKRNKTGQFVCGDKCYLEGKR